MFALVSWARETVYLAKDTSFCRATSFIPDARVFDSKEEAQAEAERLNKKPCSDTLIWRVDKAWWAADPAKFGLNMPPHKVASSA